VEYGILNLGTRWMRLLASCPSRFSLEERTPVPIALETGWALEPVWMLWRRDKSRCAGNRTLVVQPRVSLDTD
jgi:hypothetical protein